MKNFREDFENLAAAYQEVKQPSNCPEWGDGYWEGIFFAQSYVRNNPKSLIELKELSIKNGTTVFEELQKEKARSVDKI